MMEGVTPGAVRVLVVEDEYFLASDLGALLAEEGFSVMGPHGSLFGALKAIAEHLPDIVMLDVNLQGEMSYPLIDELVARSVPVIIVTGYDEQSLPSAYESCRRVIKPYSRTDILGAIGMVLAGTDHRL
ncbi:response regulator [Sphingobium sp. PNB]|uniref:response regulator n=1 Tax=Sphingobium sp. PNB TaxID=863934 RepID=UPI001CA3B1FA|nr:response regulator [Sphingobium sp. PNB]MCB4859500.1 response regulator [Sphingobium sp. PNB]